MKIAFKNPAQLYAPKIFFLAIILLWFSALFDPTGHTLHLRHIALLFIVGSILISANNVNLRLLIRKPEVLILIIIMPIYGVIIYLLRGCCNTSFIDKSYILGAILLGLSILLYINLRECLFSLNIFIKTLRILVFVELLTFIFTLLPFKYGSFFSWLMVNNIAFIDYRSYSGIYSPYIYYLASPMLIYLCAYDFMNLLKFFTRRNILLYCLSIVALFLSGTRAHMIIAILFGPLYLFIIRINWKTTLFIAPIIFIIFLYFKYVDNNYIDSIFSHNEYSNSIKMGYLSGYYEIFSDQMNLIFGQGFNAHSWSPVFSSMIESNPGSSKTEITYLELYRVFGIFLATCIIGCLFKIAVSLRKIPRKYNLEYLYPGFILYLLNSTINPYLFSSNGIWPLGLFIALLFFIR